MSPRRYKSGPRPVALKAGPASRREVPRLMARSETNVCASLGAPSALSADVRCRMNRRALGPLPATAGRVRFMAMRAQWVGPVEGAWRRGARPVTVVEVRTADDFGRALTLVVWQIQGSIAARRAGCHRHRALAR